MKYLGKIISKVYLIDLFTARERLDPMFKVTSELEDCLRYLGITVQTFQPDSAVELDMCLSIIEHSDLQDGVIIHLISHGDSTAVGFGNSEFYILWPQILPRLVAINTAANGGLIMNTTCICYGTNVFALLNEDSRAFYAAIGSTTVSSLRGWRHNKEVYSKCRAKDNARLWWEQVSANADADEQPLYEIRMSGQ